MKAFLPPSQVFWYQALSLEASCSCCRPCCEPPNIFSKNWNCACADVMKKRSAQKAVKDLASIFAQRLGPERRLMGLYIRKCNIIRRRICVSRQGWAVYLEGSYT